jgi:hypothetical protein
MDQQIRTDEDRVLRLRLDVCLDRQPISGRLRTERGLDEKFVGWLGFVDALKRLHQLEDQSASVERLPSPRGSLGRESER